VRRPSRGRRAARHALAAVGATVVFATIPAGASPAPPGADPISWSPCPGQPQDQCGSVRVPIDYAHPSAGSIDLAVIRRPASGPGPALGDLLFNPGGPGLSAVGLFDLFAAALPADVARRFDLVSFDERGTGGSDRLACGPGTAALTAAVPASDAPGKALPGTPLYARLAADCRRRYPTLLPFVDTTNSARDMDRVRRALGARRIDYYGVSYGTALGAEYATLFPRRVAAMVLDGGFDPTEPLAGQAADEAPALATSLRRYLARCGGQAPCPLGPDPVAAYAAVFASLAAHPLPPPGGADVQPVTTGDLLAATLFALSSPGFTPGFPAAVARAGEGDGAPLAALATTFGEDAGGVALAPAQWAYICQDARDHPGPRATGTLAWALARRHPPAGAAAVTNNLAGCVAWPPARQPIAGLHGPSGLPALVIGGTGDPNVPYTDAARLARTLRRARFVTWVGDGDSWLLNDPSDPCMAGVVGAYLVAGRLPAPGSRCPARGGGA